MLNLLRDLAVGPNDAPGPDNPVRQVIVNTHSPVVVQVIAPDDVLFATSRALEAGDGTVHDVLDLRPMRGSWRAAAPDAKPIGKADLIPYLTTPGAPDLLDRRVTVRALLLADGPSDAPLGSHVARIARHHGFELDVVAPDLRRLSPPPGRGVADLLAAVLAFDAGFDLVIVHRDAEAQDPQVRRDEIHRGVASVREPMPALAIVPIRMTEAWLLVDEAAIRRTAGSTERHGALGLPSPGSVEHIPDPKEVLRTALEVASGATGRRLPRFRRDFGAHRRRLLEGIDHHGPVSQLSGWQQLEATVAAVLARL
jgi:hypothetical protein